MNKRTKDEDEQFVRDFCGDRFSQNCILKLRFQERPLRGEDALMHILPKEVLIKK